MQYKKIWKHFPLLLGWGIASVILLSAVFAWHNQNSESRRTVYETILEKKRAVDQIRIYLLKSIEMEKSAVMSLTDQESMEYAKQSRDASAEVDQNLAALRTLIHSRPNEQKLLEEFAACWAELGKVDEDILQLAVKNTNLKAAALSREQGGEIMQRFEMALDEIRPALPEGQAAAMVCRAINAALKIFNLHAPHITETNDKKMDQLEARIKTEEGVVTQSLAALDDIFPTGKPESLIEAKAIFAEFMNLREP